MKPKPPSKPPKNTGNNPAASRATELRKGLNRADKVLRRFD